MANTLTTVTLMDGDDNVSYTLEVTAEEENRLNTGN